MKRYEKPIFGTIESLSIEDIMFASTIIVNNNGLDFDVDEDGGDEIWW